VIVILASRFDASAARLAERWRDRGARLLTPEGLSVRGWCHESDAPGRSTAVLHGEVVPLRSIDGVLTRLSGVSEDELPHIVPSERAYVSSEMTAFLLAWLSSLAGRVLNRPTPVCLSGPNWGMEQWAHEAVRAGFRIRPVRRLARAFGNAETDVDHGRAGPAQTDLQCVTLVGGRLFGGAIDENTERCALRLSQATNVELLTMTLAREGSSTAFISASPWVDVDRPEVADAILERWEGAR